MGGINDIPTSMKELLFKDYLKPLLREHNSNNYLYFLDQAAKIWTLNIDKKEMWGIIVTLEKGYSELYKSNTQLFIDICGEILTKRHDARVILEGYMSEYYSEKQTISKGFDFYKSLYESEFGLSISLFFAYVYEISKPELKKNKNINYVGAPSNLKYKALQEAGFRNIINHIDIVLRNGGAGHEKWQILDSGEIEITDINPYTGETKDKYIYSKEDIEKQIKKLDILGMYLDLSINIFLSNNPHINKSLVKYPGLSQQVKIAEIERRISGLCRNYQLVLKEFLFDRDNLQLVISNDTSIMGESMQMFTDRFACDMVQQKISVKYIDPMIDILLDIFHFNGKGYFNTKAHILDKDGGDVLSFDFTKDEFKLWYESKENLGNIKIYPTNISEEIHQKTYSLIIEHKIEYGHGEFVRNIVKNPLFTLEYVNFIIAMYSLE